MGRTNLFVLLSSLSCSVFVQGSPQRISAQDLAGLLREYGDEDVRIVDFRSDFERETRGYLKGSELVPNVSILNVEDREKLRWALHDHCAGANNVNLVADHLRHIEGDERIVVAMASPGDAVDKAKRTLRSLGHKNFFCYIEDLDILKKKSGGLTTYPRFIKFNVGTSTVTRIDDIPIYIKEQPITYVCVGVLVRVCPRLVSILTVLFVRARPILVTWVRKTADSRTFVQNGRFLSRCTC